MQRLYEACKQIPICLSSIKQLLRTNNYSPDQLFNVMLRFVDEDCFFETQRLLDLQGTPPQRQELHCGYLGELMEMFLQHGLTLNKVVDGQSLLSELFYVDYEYTAANTARLLLENGANPNMLLDGETIFDAIDFDIAFGHRNMRIFNERVHFWFVLIGYMGPHLFIWLTDVPISCCVSMKNTIFPFKETRLKTLRVSCTFLTERPMKR